jgi:hypothetical protein
MQNNKKHGGGAGNRELTALWQLNPAEAARRVREAYTGCDRREAARKLGVGLRTLCRWLATKPELQ